MSSSQVTFIFFRGVGLNHQPVPLISQISSSSAPPKDPPYRRAAHLRISREFNERCGLCQTPKRIFNNLQLTMINEKHNVDNI